MNTTLRLNTIYNYFNTNANDILNKYKEIKPNKKFTKQTLYNIESGKTKNISLSVSDVLCDVFPSLSQRWLIKGEGEMLNTESNQKSIGYSKQQQLKSTGTNNKVPYYDIDVTSSIVTSFSDVVEVPSFFVDYKPFNDCSLLYNYMVFQPQISATHIFI